MKITLNTVVPSGRGQCSVVFKTAFGIGQADWVGDPPEPGVDVDVELDLDDDLIWGENLAPADRAGPSIDFDQGVLTVVGAPEAAAEDGTFALRLGDSIILLEAKELPKDLPEFVRIKVRNAKAYATNI
jgi:hypothetical protein